MRESGTNVLLGRWPLCVFGLLTIVFMAAQIALAYPVCYLDGKASFFESFLIAAVYVLWPTIFVAPATAVLAVQRARMSLPTRRLWLLLPMAAVQIVVCTGIANICAMTVFGVFGRQPLSAALDRSFQEMPWVSGIAAASALLGILLGLLIARWRLMAWCRGKMVTAALTLAVVLGLIVGLVFVEHWRGEHRVEPLPAWLQLPEGATVLVSKSIGGGPMYEGPVYFLRFRCPGSPTDVMGELSTALKARGFRVMGAAREVSQHDLDGRKENPKLEPLVLANPEVRGSIMCIMDGDPTTLILYAFLEGSFSIVEMVEDISLP